jgi:biotin transporter BioY
MLIAWVRMALLVLLSVMGLGFGFYPTLFGTGAATFVAASFGFDAMWLVGMGLIGSVALRDWRMAAWLPVFFCFDQVVNLYSAITFRRGLSAVWKPPERAKREVLV